MASLKRLRRTTVLAFLIVLLTQLAPVQAARPIQDVVADELIVRLHPSADVQSLERRAGLRLMAQIPRQHVYRFSILDGLDPHLKAAALYAQPGVLAAEPNYKVLSPWAVRRVTWVVGSNVDGYMAQWAPERLGLNAAHTVSRGAGVIVAILDTGVDPDHPALAGRLASGYDFVADDADPREEGSAEVDAAFGHGTHVAGLVALVAPDTTILPLRTLGPDGSGDLWTQLVALNYAFAQGAAVINLSFSFGKHSRIFDETIGAITCGSAIMVACRGDKFAGAVVVAAAGNSGAAVREYPGASARPGVLGVAASTRGDGLASFSTFGSWLPLAAPGEEIVSSVPGGGYAAWSGTSMATPLVAGTVALVRSAYPALGPAEAALRIVETADPISARVRRRINAAAAVAPATP